MKLSEKIHITKFSIEFGKKIFLQQIKTLFLFINFYKKGGGGYSNLTSLVRGGLPNLTSSDKGGRGGPKSSKKT